MIKPNNNILTLAICGLFAMPANGAELYLPQSLDPVIQAKIEKLLVKANQPIIKRPIAVKQVRVALDNLGDSDPALTASIKRYLKRFDKRLGFSHASASLSASSGESHPHANERGASSNDSYNIAYAGFWQTGNWLTLNLGGIAYDGSFENKDEFLEGSFISIGNEYLQADIGNRVHWFGPFQESDMLQSTHASAAPGITLSNITPLTRFGFRYEIFFSEMSKSNAILSDDRSERMSGNPRLFGLHASAEPINGFSLSVNRLMQYGGADRDDSFKSLLDAFFHAGTADNIGNKGNDFGNQLSSFATRYTFAGDNPVSIYMEYAGEDTSAPSDFHVGNTSLMLGVHLPELTNNLDATYEFAEWQNGWYVNTNYGDGLRQYGSTMGHWGASNRVFHDAVGSSAHVGKLNWYIRGDKTLLTTYRQINNKEYTGVDYETGYEIQTEYSQQFQRYTLGVRLTAGNDVFGEGYSQVSGIIRW